MTDSPLLSAPLDEAEQPILDSLLKTRERLCLLKCDKSNYIRSDDVVAQYRQVIEQVHALNEVRSQRDAAREQNRVDRVLDDCFQLISLFYMTIGRNSEAPASYALSSTMKRLLEHLREVGIYSAKDLQSIGTRIEAMRGDLRRAGDRHDPHLLTLLGNRLDANQLLLQELKEKIPNLCDTMSPVYEKLVSILRSMAAANTRCNFPTGEVLDFQRQLKEMQASVVDGKYVVDGNVPRNQEVVVDLLDRVLKWSDIVLERKGKITEGFTELYDKLRCIRNALEKLSLTQAWSLRETDLYGYQRDLDRIDESRVNGNFLDAQGKPADLHAQRTLLYLIRRSYAYIWTLILSSEPVSEALLPIYNQLNTLRRCLEEVQKNGGVSSPRELFPYGMKLSSIDNMRKDGKFMVDKDIPEGQGSVNALLAECFEQLHELRIGYDESGDAEASEDTPRNSQEHAEPTAHQNGDTKVPAAAAHVNGDSKATLPAGDLGSCTKAPIAPDTASAGEKATATA